MPHAYYLLLHLLTLRHARLLQHITLIDRCAHPDAPLETALPKPLHTQVTAPPIAHILPKHCCTSLSRRPMNPRKGNLRAVVERYLTPDTQGLMENLEYIFQMNFFFITVFSQLGIFFSDSKFLFLPHLNVDVKETKRVSDHGRTIESLSR